MGRREEENRTLKSDLQDTLDRSAISTEELKASNEELEAITEELRSAKEEAFKHAEAISASGEAADFRAAAGIDSSASRPAGVSTGADGAMLVSAFTADIAAHRHWDRVAKDAMAA